MGVKPSGRAFVELGQSLRHIALYRTPGGKISFRTETRLQAMNNARLNNTPVRPRLEDGSLLMFSLCSGDILVRKTPEGHLEYLVVRKVN